MPKMRKSSLHRSSRNRRRSNLRLVLLLILVLAVASLLIWTIVSDSKNAPSSSDLPGESERGFCTGGEQPVCHRGSE